ncbi:MAG: 3-hydroxyisobutyrate dehydrogenase [Pseudomonadota bacterium]
MNEVKRICFIGLGTMGLPMTQRLQDQGFDVAAWDLSTAAGAELKGRCSSLSQAAEGADYLITMLPEGRHVAEVHKAVQGMAGPARRIFIDCSTIDVTTTRHLAEKAAAHGLGFVDAPVSGGAEGARAGALSFMTGGDGADVERVKPVLAAMGTKVLHFGTAGSGQAAKACHNMICGITALAVCESFALADALDLDPQKFFDLCKGAAAQSWILENRCPVPGLTPDAPSSKAYAPGFAARLMAKDLGLAQEAAQAAGQATPFGAEAARRFGDYVADADAGKLDFSAIYRTIRQGG